MLNSAAGRIILCGLLFAGGYGSGLLTMALWPMGQGKADVSAELAHGSSVVEVARPQPPADRGSGFRPEPERGASASRHSMDRITSLASNPRLLRAAVAQYSDDELLEMIGAYTRLAPHDLPEDVAVAEVAERLADIYYGDSYDRAGNPLDNPGFVGGMEFDVSKAPANRVVDPRELFAGTDKRIYASFETGGYEKREVMVKWSRVDSAEVLIYDKYPIMAGADHNYVWLEQPQGWDVGDYQVEIYSLEDNLSLLARGSYGVD